MSAEHSQEPEQQPAQPEKWKPDKLPATGVHTATFSLKIKNLKAIQEEVKAARAAGYNRTKSGLVNEALELYFNSRRR